VNSKMREQTNIKGMNISGLRYSSSKTPGVTVGTDLGKRAERNWMKSINLLLPQI